MEEFNKPNFLIGRFYFKKTHNGNLIGEFSNNRINYVSTESADLQNKEEKIDFAGTYNTTWQEKGNPHFCKIIIKHKLNISNKIYHLEWIDTNNNQLYTGEGFVFDDILIGDYRNFIIL